MTPPWRAVARVWKAKGYSHTTAADALEEKFGRGKGYGRSRIALLVTTQHEPCPSEAAKFILDDLPILNQETWAKYLREGATEQTLSADPGAAPATTPEPSDASTTLFAALGGKLDAVLSAIVAAGGKLDTVLSAVGGKVDAILSTVGGKVDAIFSAVGTLDAAFSALNGKLDAARSSLGGKVDAILSAVGKLDAALSVLGDKLDAALLALRTIEATVNHTDAKQDVEHARLDRATRKVLRAVYGSTGLLLLGLGVCVVGLLFVAVSRPAHAPEAVPQQVIIVTNMGPGGTPLGFDMRTLLGAVAGQVGEKVVDQYIPDRPLPNQKVPPCLGEAREEAMSGGCWTEIKGAPPCGRYLFRRGGSCYRPIAADPSKPVGGEPRPGQGEPTGEQPRPMKEMPGREEH